MKKLLLTFALSLLSFTLATNLIPITITEIYDGDTIRVKLINKNEFNIRLYGIDCFETSKIHRAYKQAYDNNLSIDEVIKKGLEAKRYLRKLKNNSKEFSFEFRGIDKYGRILGVLYFDNENINEKMLENDFCNIYEFKEETLN